MRLLTLLLLLLLVACSLGAGSIGTLNASPSAVYTGTPTTVIFTIRIDDAAHIANSTQLLRVNGSSRILVGAMLDNGINGDAIAGDKVYSLPVQLSESNPGALQYQASAAYKGELKRAISNTVDLSVLPSAIIGPNGGSVSTPEGFIYVVTPGMIRYPVRLSIRPLRGDDLPKRWPPLVPYYAAYLVNFTRITNDTGPLYTDTYNPALTIPLDRPMTPGTRIILMTFDDGLQEYVGTGDAGIVTPIGNTATINTKYSRILLVVRPEDLG